MDEVEIFCCWISINRWEEEISEDILYWAGFEQRPMRKKYEKRWVWLSISV